MSLTVIAIIGIVLMLVLLFLRMPIGFVMALVGFIGISYLSGGIEKGSYSLTSAAYSTSGSYLLSVIPLFTLMGVLGSYAGLSEDAFFAANKWLGHLPGGLAIATVGGCTGFAAVCGSAAATAATMCTVSLKEMRRYKYSDQLSLGTIACGGTLGFMIPPSIPFVIYGQCNILCVKSWRG